MKLQSIQLLRALAAYLVVVHHVLHMLSDYLGVSALRHPPRVFMSGVDVFFVISGFVMAETTARSQQASPRAFLRARFLRIAPTYWLLTLCAFALQRQGLKLFGHGRPTALELLSSLTFGLPFDGQPAREPLLFVGWSLEYEMLFYLLFALALWVRPARGPRVLTVLLVVGLGVLGMFADNPYLQHWGKPIILEFAGGVLVWRLWRGWSASVPAATASLLVGVLGLVATGLLDDPWYAHERALYFGVPASLIVFGAVSLDRRGIVLGKPWMWFQGDASYALYLTHPFVLQAIGKMVVVAGIEADVARMAVFTVASALLVPAVGTAFYRWIERPLGALAASGRRVASDRAVARA